MPDETKKLDLHKVLSTIGIILTIVIVIIAAVWYFLDRNSPSEIEEDNQVKVSTSSAKKATTSAEVDETATWRQVSNTTVGYSLKYPENWLLNGTSLNQNCDDETIFLAPTQELLGLCASGYSGLIYIARTTSGDDLAQQLSFHNEDDYENFQKTDTIVGGKTAVKISGTSLVNNEVIDKRGQKEIIYFVDLGDRVLIIGYYQPTTVQDYSEFFEKIVTTIKFN